MCVPFKENKDMPKMVPLEFTENGVTCVASKLSDAADALGVEVIQLKNWLIHSGCAPEELRVIVAKLADCMAKSSPTWAA